MKKIFLSIIATVVLISCGYSTSSLLPAKFTSIYIDRFENAIDYTSERNKTLYLPLLEQDVRTAIIDRFQFDGSLRIAQSENATMVLRGKLLHYQREDLRLTENDDIQEYRISITVSLELWDMTTGELMWSESGFGGSEDYFLTGANATSEDAALAGALEDLARRVVERTIEDW